MNGLWRSIVAGVPSDASPPCGAISSYRIEHVPERRGAVARGLDAGHADVAEISVVQAREQLPVAPALTPGGDVFDQSDQRASENRVKPRGSLRARRFGRVKKLGPFPTFLGSAHTG